jgi:hypothetical protein
MVATPGAVSSSSLVHWWSLSYLLGATLVLGLVVAPLVYMFLRCVLCVRQTGACRRGVVCGC